jgi:hypothetical protein
MAFVTIANAAAIEIRLLFNLQRCALTLGFQKPGAITQAQLDHLTHLIAVWWQNNGRHLVGNQVMLVEVYGRDLTTYGGITSIDTDYSGNYGDMYTEEHLPQNCSLCVSFRTALRGRANRGRNYWLGFGIHQMDTTNYVKQEFVDDLLEMYEKILPGGSADPTPFVWSVLSRQLDGVPIGRAIPITNVLCVDRVVDSQRRRLPGRGL